MTQKIDWFEISDSYARETPQIIGEAIRPTRLITVDDLDDIFAGRPLSDTPRAKASVMRKTYLTPEMADKADRQAKEEHLSGTALIRKAPAAYLADPSGQSARIPQSA